jgi:hypothetical protein
VTARVNVPNHTGDQQGRSGVGILTQLSNRYVAQVVTFCAVTCSDGFGFVACRYRAGAGVSRTMKFSMLDRSRGVARACPFSVTRIGYQRNAKLQLTVLLAPPEAVPELYLHPEHRRRRWRPVLRTEFDV